MNFFSRLVWGHFKLFFLQFLTLLILCSLFAANRDNVAAWVQILSLTVTVSLGKAFKPGLPSTVALDESLLKSKMFSQKKSEWTVDSRHSQWGGLYPTSCSSGHHLHSSERSSCSRCEPTLTHNNVNKVIYKNFLCK